jgi:hypothetical protein
MGGDLMGKHLTTDKINVSKLSADTGKGVSTRGVAPEEDGPKEIEIPDLRDSEVAAAVAAHVFDPDFGRPAGEQRLRQIRNKAHAVLNAGESFTNPQRDAILATLVLRELREED